ncbi:MAG: hypothetical protein L3J34_03945 [Flavobacteriaceae bacterium]|nr:hypothetical protein [Flavobacteriaceae bacterium]
MHTNTQARAEIIDKFLNELQLKPTDLARYLELNHDFCCYAYTQFDHTE